MIHHCGKGEGGAVAARMKRTEQRQAQARQTFIEIDFPRRRLVLGVGLRWPARQDPTIDEARGMPAVLPTWRPTPAAPSLLTAWDP